MIYLFLLKYIPRQVILTCDKQTKCIVGDYCSSHKLCYTCSYITNNHCDSFFILTAFKQEEILSYNYDLSFFSTRSPHSVVNCQCEIIVQVIQA